MNTPGELRRGFALTMAMLLGSAAAASAAPMLLTVEGAEHDELSATILFTYVGLTDSTGRVDVSLTNTSSAFDPRLTAFAFNLPDAVHSIDGFTSSLGRWQADYEPDAIRTPGQLGFFDVAALTGPNFNGGSPRKGLARGATADFSFVLAGTGMLGLTEGSFLNLGSDEATRRVEEIFAARFQQVGLGGAQSDVASPGGPPPAAVSEPTSLLLFGLGLLGLATMHRGHKGRLRR